MKQPRVCRIFIVDDHPTVRQGIMAVVAHESDMQVCGEAGDEQDALQQITALLPNVAIIDISLKTGNGLELVKRIKARHPGINMLVWSMFPDSLYAARALRAGALGYLNKSDSTEHLVEAIHTVSRGKVYLAEAASRRLLQDVFTDKAAGNGALPLERLSDRELDVFKLIGEGISTTHIAGRMNISVSTVETYRQRIKSKLNINNNAELVQTAVQWLLQGSQ